MRLLKTILIYLYKISILRTLLFNILFSCDTHLYMQPNTWRDENGQPITLVLHPLNLASGFFLFSYYLFSKFSKYIPQKNLHKCHPTAGSSGRSNISSDEPTECYCSKIYSRINQQNSVSL